MTDKAPAPTEHSDLLGGSSAERRYHCAASFRLEPGLPGSESPAASRGTRLHAAIAQMLSDTEPEGVSKAEVDDVLRPAMEAFDTLCDEHGVDRVIIERKVGTQVGDIEDAFGTIDVIGLGEDVALFADWKFGFLPVEAADNKQLRFYAYAAWNDAKLLHMFSPRMKIVTAIIQPSRGDDMVSTAEVTLRELKADAAAWASNYGAREDAPVRGDWCRWCKAKPSCSAHSPTQADSQAAVASLMAKQADVEADDPFADIPHTPPAPDFGAVAAMVEGLPFDADAPDAGEMLAGWRSIQERVASRVNALERQVFTSIEAGRKVAGWKLVEKRASRAWADPDKAERMLRRLIGADAACPRSLISPPQAEKALGANYGRAERYVVRRSTGVKLVQEGDERGAADAAVRFESLGAQIQSAS